MTLDDLKREVSDALSESQIKGGLLTDVVRTIDHLHAQGYLQLWQTIETAPKDGTRVLAIGGVFDHEETGGEYRGKLGFPVIVAWECYSGKLFVWRMENSCGYYEKCEPTHWMPLPKPPEKTK